MALGALPTLAATPPAPSPPAGHWQGSLQFAAGGTGANLVDVLIRGSGRRMTGTITYLGNPCNGPLRKATWQGAGRWRFRYIERSHNAVACPSGRDGVQVMRVGPNLFVRSTTAKSRIPDCSRACPERASGPTPRRAARALPGIPATRER